eukprot:scaffold86684_cov36-Phaeocystis_antarctica.AAC.1
MCEAEASALTPLLVIQPGIELSWLVHRHQHLRARPGRDEEHSWKRANLAEARALRPNTGLVRLECPKVQGSIASPLGRPGPRLGQCSPFLSPLVRPRGSRQTSENPQSDHTGRRTESVARIAGEARKPKLHTVARVRRISRKAKRLSILAVLSMPVQRQEEE